jgi:hypothetical protein
MYKRKKIARLGRKIYMESGGIVPKKWENKDGYDWSLLKV